MANVDAFYSGTINTSLAPRFVDISQNATYGALYDQYRITHVEWTFTPVFQAYNFSSGIDNVPLIYVVIDNDDTTVPTTMDSLREYQSVQSHLFKDFKISITPRISAALYTGAAFNGFGNPGPMWIDCGSNNVPHMGLKVGVEAGTAAQTRLQKWYVTTKLHIEFRAVR